MILFSLCSLGVPLPPLPTCMILCLSLSTPTMLLLLPPTLMAALLFIYISGPVGSSRGPLGQSGPSLSYFTHPPQRRGCMGPSQLPPQGGASVLSVRPRWMGGGGTTYCTSALSYLLLVIVPSGGPLYPYCPRDTMLLLCMPVSRSLPTSCPV